MIVSQQKSTNSFGTFLKNLLMARIRFSAQKYFFYFWLNFKLKNILRISKFGNWKTSSLTFHPVSGLSLWYNPPVVWWAGKASPRWDPWRPSSDHREEGGTAPSCWAGTSPASRPAPVGPRPPGPTCPRSRSGPSPGGETPSPGEPPAHGSPVGSPGRHNWIKIKCQIVKIFKLPIYPPKWCDKQTRQSYLLVLY